MKISFKMQGLKIIKSNIIIKNYFASKLKTVFGGLLRL